MTALELIDKLIASWTCWGGHEDFYLKELAPAIMRGDRSNRLGTDERQTIENLKQLLSDDEWGRLPELLAARRAGRLQEIESDRNREEKRCHEREERLVRESREAEERQQREKEQLDRERKDAEEQEKLEREQLDRKQSLIQRIQAQFETDFLTADELMLRDPDRELLGKDGYVQLKSQFIQEWVDRVLDRPIDPQQASAVGSVTGDVQVVARAGAGKTRTLVTRAIFLIKHCRVSPKELLLLAFNKNAATKMSDALRAALGEQLPHVMTFHALAYALVHPDEELLYDDASAGTLGLSKELQRVIDEHLQSDPHRQKIRDLMLMHFRKDWERIAKGGFHLRIEELIKHRNALPRETLKGEYVKSFGEKLIANTLFEHDIEYKYERNYRWNGINYKPDFTVVNPGSGRRGVAIEYFGLKGDRDYDEMSKQKREFWAMHAGWVFLEFSPHDITCEGVNAFKVQFLRRLSATGIIGHCLSDEELWQRIRRRAVDKFTRAVRSFVSRCRKHNLSHHDLSGQIDNHVPVTEAERLFLDVGTSVHSEYLNRLEVHHQEDFDGLMWNAIERVDSGEHRFVRDRGRERGDLRRVRFVLIDEFQDFSAMFYRLTRGVRALNPNVGFFCVGDDWQAINGFAGSELRFFEDFPRFFDNTSTVEVITNYRSPVQVVQLGNALMVGHGTPARPHQEHAGWVRVAYLDEFSPSAAEQARHIGDEATPAVLRLVNRLLNSGRDVVMLSRRNGVPWYVHYQQDEPQQIDGLERFAEHIRSYLPEEDRGRVTASTAHKYKGDEKGAVIILDADEGSYPLIHPTWTFLRIFGDSVERIEAEERRLFYVALTRSQYSLVLLSDSRRRESPYLTDITKRMCIDAIEWSALRPVASLDCEILEIRVSRAFKVRDQLKGLQYRWNEKGKYWFRSVPASDFDFDELSKQPWATQGVHIAVYTETGKLVQQK